MVWDRRRHQVQSNLWLRILVKLSESSSHPFDLAVAAKMRELTERFPLGYQAQVVWRGYRVTAGMAYYKKGVIGLSYRVLTDEKMVIDTLVHEYAHLLAVSRHGHRAANHGPEWQQAMLDLGETPKVRHTYTVERNVARQRVTYQCVKCGKPIVRTRRLPAKRRYIHVDCGGALKLAKIERITSVKLDS